jgi:hypothetical protein
LFCKIQTTSIFLHSRYWCGNLFKEAAGTNLWQASRYPDWGPCSHPQFYWWMAGQNLLTGYNDLLPTQHLLTIYDHPQILTDAI